MSFFIRPISVCLLLISGQPTWAATPSPSASAAGTDPVPMVVTFLGTALVGLWIWARRK